MPMTPFCIEKAVEIAKAAIPIQAGTWIDKPDTVAKFIETIAVKIDELSHRKG
jgi:protein-L-isoaspartate O-methyltransferase